ncbi:aldo/keto reductase [Spelaeicoccus albus]|uniref:Aryl-alcohol dehydrogenase-like predicted oxidoreductase n=1 Tax=Spelaeicoccus albus TaxID=1280376 RepID=A0A7Z0D1F1_9MICO|nr:aldo/keto reductase [Spelaeicoccus albus]NYI66908.1 aryl-alcohol dehydrogenase-like predicted oxidoreductase [Spelaeicoccus albus]
MTNSTEDQISNHTLTIRTLGAAGPAVTSPGLGGMSLSGAYGHVDEDESVAVVHAYLDAGGTLIDTADFYAAGHNEMLIARALRERSRDDVVLSVKFGAQLTPSGLPQGFNGSPANVKTSLAYSLQRLGTDHVDIYRPARLDPDVPIEDTVGAVKDLVDDGYVRHIGLSEVGADTIRRAAAVAPISDVQIEYSLLSRGIESNGILETCRELGIGITAYGVLGKGLLGGGTTGGARSVFPRFQGENLAHNQALVEPLRTIAEAKGATLAQLAIAWVAAQDKHVVPIVGSRRTSQVQSLVDSNRVTLTSDDLAEITKLVPPGAVHGERYPDAAMSELDSER